MKFLLFCLLQYIVLVFLLVSNSGYIKKPVSPSKGLGEEVLEPYNHEGICVIPKESLSVRGGTKCNTGFEGENETLSMKNYLCTTVQGPSTSKGSWVSGDPLETPHINPAQLRWASAARGSWCWEWCKLPAQTPLLSLWLESWHQATPEGEVEI